MLTDYDLCMLEHLAYMNNDDGLKSILKDGVESYRPLQECTTVKEYLDQFDTDALRNNDPNGYTNGDSINRQEYAAIIDYMCGNEDINSLTLNGSMANEHANTCPLAYDFVSDSNEHIVIFKGSTEAYEWKDNVEGIAKADTQSQIDAVNFVNSIDSDNITVVGHSKGGNKAMYCAIVSDKVKRCISMDGQGFSDEFISKYRYKIDAKSKNIKNISYCSDYVHALMRQIPGSTQLYTGKGYGSNGADSVAGCHSPNTLFSYYTDENGTLCVKEELEFGEETHSIQVIYGLVEYIMYSDCEDKEGVINYLAYVVGQLGGNSEDYINRVLSGQEELDNENATQLLAYVIKYCNENNISPEQIYLLLLDIHAIDAGITKWGGMDPLDVIRLLFDYISSNEKDQNYIAAKLAVLLADRVFDKDKSHDKLYDTAWKLLKNIKGKYDSIRFDASKKTLTYAEKLIPITLFSDFHEAGAIKMYYNLQGIQSALSKMSDALNCNYDTSTLSSQSIFGEAVDSFDRLGAMYDDMYERLSELIKSTQTKVQAVNDAVEAVEGIH